MNIEFRKIDINNFMSFGHSEIALDTPGYILVKGVNNSDNDFATSNGSGKSSIWEAISWVLTGETIRGCKNVSNINGDDGALVELTFDIDGKEYIVTRSKDHSKLKSSLKIMIDGTDKSGKGIRDSEKLLSQYLPELNASLIGSVIILGQGLPQRFTNNTPSGRKDVLEKLSKSDFMIEDIKKRLSDRTSVFTTKKRKFEDSSIELQTEQSVLVRTIASKKEELSRLEPVNVIKDKIKAVDSQLTMEQSSYDTECDEIASLDNEIQTLTHELQQIKSENERNKTEIKLEYDEQIHKLDVDYASLNAQKNALQAEINKKKSITDVCPTCGQKLVGVVKPDVTLDIENLNHLNVQLKELSDSKALLISQRDNKIYSYHVNTREEVGEYEVKIEAVEEKSKDAYYRHRQTESNIKRLQSKLSELNLKLQNSTSIAATLTNDIDKSNARLVDIEKELLYNKNELDNVDIHLGILNKMSTYVKRDFRGYLLLNVIDFLDRKAKSYCKDIFGHNNMSFALEGNNINICINGKEYEQLSGGEKQKIDLIIQLSVRDMLCKYSNFSSNLFVLDEIFDNLDEVGSEQVLNLLSTKLEDVSSIYIVTHHASIPVPVDRELLVIKDSTGITRAEG